jgi:hypothetical protein
MRSDHIFEIEQEVNGVFLHAGDWLELAQHAFDAHAGNRCARDGRQQHAAQGVAQRHAVAALQRLDFELPVVRLAHKRADLRLYQ